MPTGERNGKPGIGMLMRCASFLAALGISGAARAAVDPALDWAFPKEGPPERPPGMYHVDGSPLAPLSKEQLDNMSVLPDWLPDLHPPAPFIVLHSRKHGADACAECHQVDGRGFLSTAGLAGLPASYIVEQIHEFRDGRRVSSQQGRQEVEEMIGEAKALTDADLAEAAEYFAAIPTQHWVNVVETDTVPRTSVGRYDWLLLDPKGGTEAIDGRIIEVCRDIVALENGDPRVVDTDYVPTGSVAKGSALAHRPNGNGQTCATCHGESMQGTPLAPPLAGNYASYLTRAIWDIKSGARRGPAVALMAQVVAPLTSVEITRLSAYLASLPRPGGPPAAYISPVPPAASQPKS